MAYNLLDMSRPKLILWNSRDNSFFNVLHALFPAWGIRTTSSKTYAEYNSRDSWLPTSSSMRNVLLRLLDLWLSEVSGHSKRMEEKYLWCCDARKGGNRVGKMAISTAGPSALIYSSHSHSSYYPLSLPHRKLPWIKSNEWHALVLSLRVISGHQSGIDRLTCHVTFYDYSVPRSLSPLVMLRSFLLITAFVLLTQATYPPLELV